MPLNAQVLRAEIEKVYSQVVDDPKKGYHFHTGPHYAVERLGYAQEELADLPDTARAVGRTRSSPRRLSVRRARSSRLT